VIHDHPEICFGIIEQRISSPLLLAVVSISGEMESKQWLTK
jgi:hypothetical protein